VWYAVLKRCLAWWRATMPAHSASASASATMCYCYYRRESGITSAKAAIIKAETVQVFKDKRKLPCQNALVKHVHIRTPACHRDTNTSYRTVQADMVIRSGEYSEYKYEYSPT
jgi:hypothetical protein